jgi:hypothetical protein
MYSIKFKGIDKTVKAIIVYTSKVLNVQAPHEVIPVDDRQVMEIHFPSTSDFSELLSIYEDEDALSEISIINDSTNETWVHLNYVIPLSLNLKSYGTASEVAMYGTDRWIMTLAQLTESDKQFRQVIGVAAKSASYLSLDEYISTKVTLSKEKLETFLSEHPLISACKDGIYKKYNVSTEKQNQFAAQFAVYSANKASGIEDVFTWNEMGQPCVPWTDAECLVWMNDTKNYTKPLVSAQQEYEVELKQMETKAEVEAYDIDYSTIATVNGMESWIGHTVDEIKQILAGEYGQASDSNSADTSDASESENETETTEGTDETKSV